MDPLPPATTRLAPLEPARVLVAEDDPETRHAIAATLARDGFQVSEARDGYELIEIVEAAAREDGEAPDLLVSDISMPGLTGLAAIAELRDRLAHTAIVIVTALRDDVTIAEAYRLGAVGVLEKPFELDELLAMVHRVADATAQRPPSPARG